MAKTKKYYVVWKGVNPGIYDEWLTCKAQVEGHDDAKYKAFESRQEAAEAFEKGYEHYIRPRRSESGSSVSAPLASVPANPISPALCVDAACSGNPGDMEYRGVYYPTGQQIFRIGPLAKGTNNVGEFLALVHGLALLKQHNAGKMPIYTDSRNAMTWVAKKKCKTLLERVPENEKIFELIERAEKWLAENEITNPIYKWATEVWGEIPADFGRKR